jgi:hypothetical protein
MLFTANDLTNSRQYKKKTPSSGRTPSDVTRQSSSASLQPATSKLSRNDDAVPISQILSLLLDLSRNMAAMRDVINDIRFQNHVAYRQLKRIQLQQGKCSGVGGNGALMTSSAETAYQLKKPETGRKAQSLLKSGKVNICRSSVELLSEINVKETSI